MKKIKIGIILGFVILFATTPVLAEPSYEYKDSYGTVGATTYSDSTQPNNLDNNTAASVVSNQAEGFRIGISRKKFVDEYGNGTIKVGVNSEGKGTGWASGLNAIQNSYQTCEDEQSMVIYVRNNLAQLYRPKSTGYIAADLYTNNALPNYKSIAAQDCQAKYRRVWWSRVSKDDDDSKNYDSTEAFKTLHAAQEAVMNCYVSREGSTVSDEEKKESVSADILSNMLSVKKEREWDLNSVKDLDELVHAINKNIKTKDGRTLNYDSVAKDIVSAFIRHNGIVAPKSSNETSQVGTAGWAAKCLNAAMNGELGNGEKEDVFWYTNKKKEKAPQEVRAFVNTYLIYSSMYVLATNTLEKSIEILDSNTDASFSEDSELGFERGNTDAYLEAISGVFDEKHRFKRVITIEETFTCYLRSSFVTTKINHFTPNELNWKKIGLSSANNQHMIAPIGEYLSVHGASGSKVIATVWITSDGDVAYDKCKWQGKLVEFKRDAVFIDGVSWSGDKLKENGWWQDTRSVWVGSHETTTLKAVEGYYLLDSDKKSFKYGHVYNWLLPIFGVPINLFDYSMCQQLNCYVTMTVPQSFVCISGYNQGSKIIDVLQSGKIECNNNTYTLFSKVFDSISENLLKYIKDHPKTISSNGKSTTSCMTSQSYLWNWQMANYASRNDDISVAEAGLDESAGTTYLKVKGSDAKQYYATPQTWATYLRWNGVLDQMWGSTYFRPIITTTKKASDIGDVSELQLIWADPATCSPTQNWYAHTNACFILTTANRSDDGYQVLGNSIWSKSVRSIQKKTVFVTDHSTDNDKLQVTDPGLSIPNDNWSKEIPGKYAQWGFTICLPNKLEAASLPAPKYTYSVSGLNNYGYIYDDKYSQNPVITVKCTSAKSRAVLAKTAVKTAKDKARIYLEVKHSSTSSFGLAGSSSNIESSDGFRANPTNSPPRVVWVDSAGTIKGNLTYISNGIYYLDLDKNNIKDFYLGKTYIQIYDTTAGSIYPTENITLSYDVKMSVWWTDKKTYTKCPVTSYEYKNHGNISQSNFNKVNSGTKSPSGTVQPAMIDEPISGNTGTFTRSVVYHHMDSTNDKHTIYSELKDNIPGKETYDATSGVPTTEKLFLSLGGTSFIFDVRYTSKYNQTIDNISGVSYLHIEDVKVYVLNGATITSNDVPKVFDATGNNLTINDESGTRYSVVIKPASATPVGSNYRITGEQLVVKVNDTPYTIIHTSYYVPANWNAVRTNVNYYDTYRGYESLLTVDAATSGDILLGSHGAVSNVFGAYYPNANHDLESRLDRTNLDINYTNQGYNGEAYNTTEATNSADQFNLELKPKMYASATANIYGTKEIKLTCPNGVYFTDAKVTPIYKDINSSALLTDPYLKNYTVRYTDRATAKRADANINDVVVHNPISIRTHLLKDSNADGETAFSDGSDSIRSFKNITYSNTDASVSEAYSGEPSDQRTEDSRKSSALYMNNKCKNKTFLGYDFAIGVDFIGDFSGNKATKTFGVDNNISGGNYHSQQKLGKGLYNRSLDTRKWIRDIYVKFPMDVVYNNTYYDTGDYIKVKEVGNTSDKNNSGFKPLYTKDSAYIISGFSIPTSAEEIKSVEDVNNISLYVTAINDPISDVSAINEDNTSLVVNAKRNSNLAAKHAISNGFSADVVGHIGNLNLTDTGDFTFSNYFKKPTNDALVWPLIYKVDQKEQRGIFTDVVDMLSRAKEVKSNKIYGDTFRTLDVFKMNSDKEYINSFPFLPSIAHNSIVGDGKTAYKDRYIRKGYSMYMSLETIGNYYGKGRFYENTEDGQEVRVKPYYYVKNADGEYENVSVWLMLDGNYKKVCVNDDSALLRKEGENNDNIEPYYVTLRVSEESDRRMIYNDTKEYDITNTDLSELYWKTENESDYVTSELGSNPYRFDKSINIGTLQSLHLRDSVRTFIGSSSYNNSPSSVTSVTSKYLKKGQRWHFTLGLPSGAVFTKDGDNPNKNPKCILSDNDVRVTCGMTATATGDVWVLQYGKGVDALKDLAIPIPPGTVDPPPVKITEIPPNESSSKDLSTRGTH